MAGVAQLNQFPCKTLCLTLPYHQPKTSLLSLTAIGAAPSSFADGPKLSTRRLIRARPVFRVRVANNDDEWGPEKEEPYGEGGSSSAVAVAEGDEEEEKTSVELSEIAKLKRALVDSFYGTDRGLKATSETRAEIIELITQLEAQNPNPAPTEALTLLNGKWILA